MQASQKLSQLLFELFEKIFNHPPEEKDVHNIDQLLHKTGLNIDAKIPSWFLDFITAIVEKKEGRKYFKSDDNEMSRICNLISEISKVLNAELEDSGEYISIGFEKYDLEAVIFLEGRSYEISA